MISSSTGKKYTNSQQIPETLDPRHQVPGLFPVYMVMDFAIQALKSRDFLMASENSILGHYGMTKLGMGSYGFAASKCRARSLGGVTFHVMYLERPQTDMQPACMHPENLNTTTFSFVVTRKQRDRYKSKKGEIL